MRLALLGKGEWLTARRAMELGLIGELVDADALVPRAKALAKLAAGVNQAAVRAQKVALRRGIAAFHAPAVEAAREWSSRFARDTNQQDIAAGASAFVHDRPLSTGQRRQQAPQS